MSSFRGNESCGVGAGAGVGAGSGVEVGVGAGSLVVAAVAVDEAAEAADAADAAEAAGLGRGRFFTFATDTAGVGAADGVVSIDGVVGGGAGSATEDDGEGVADAVALPSAAVTTAGGRLADAARWRITTMYVPMPARMPIITGTSTRMTPPDRFGAIVARSGPGFSGVSDGRCTLLAPPSLWLLAPLFPYAGGALENES